MIFPRRTSRWGLVEQRTRCCSTSCCTELTFKGIALGWGMVVFSFFSFSFHSLPYLSDLFLRGCTSAHAWQRVAWYRARWIVEDFHHGLKTGCRIEQRQLQTYEGLRTLLGVLSPEAVRLLQLRNVARQAPEQPAQQVLPADLGQVVAHLAHVPTAQLTTQQCWYTIARQGGYLGRKGDGPPGWKTLWLGWFYVQTLLEGVHLATRLSFDASSDP